VKNKIENRPNYQTT